MSIPSLPGRRRAVPAPFARPSVDLDRHGRCWAEVPPGWLRAGDTVAGVGALTSDPVKVSEGSADVWLLTAVGMSKVVPDAEPVRAHVRRSVLAVPTNPAGIRLPAPVGRHAYPSGPEAS